MSTRSGSLALAVLSALLLWPAAATAADAAAPAHLIYPQDGVTATDARVDFVWTPVEGAEAYYLYVGSVPGTSDIVNSREIQQTTLTAVNLPANSSLYVRLWTKLAGRWTYVDSGFTVAPLKATVFDPPDGASDVSVQKTLRWSGVSGAQAYVLWIGSSAGGADVLTTPETASTAYTPARIPANQQLFARLWTKAGGIWRYADSRFTTAPAAVLITPANGASEVDLTEITTWTPVATAQAYYLYVGTSPGARDVIDSGETQQTSYSGARWPGGRRLYARLWTKSGDRWRFEDTVFDTEPAASLSSPLPGATAVALTQAFSWVPIEQAQAYRLLVGSAAGANDVADSNEISTTSYQPPARLPANSTLYARLWTKWGNRWRAVDTQFSTSPVAQLTAPADGARNVAPNPLFTWTPIGAAQAYVLTVGTTPGAGDVFKTIESLQTSHQATALPANRTLYARMWTKAGGTWRYIDSTFTVAVVTATITSPQAGATDVGVLDPIRWTTVENAEGYVLWVGTSVGTSDVFKTPEIEETFYYPMSLPARRTLYARIWTSVGGVWRYSDSSFSAAPLTAELLSPANGAPGVDPSLPAIWTRVPGAQAHVLYVGSSPGEHDLLVSPEVPQTSYPISSLRPGHVYARLWTQVAGVWRFVDSDFTVASRSPQFLQPVDGALAVDPSLPFRWTPSLYGQAYRLTIGTSPGGSDVLNSGELLDTSYALPGPLPNGPLYARVAVKLGGVWTLRSDIRFTLDNTTSIAFIGSPQNRTASFDTANPFTWNAAPFANAYRLSIGTQRGRYDLHDSGPIHVTERYVPDLPIGVRLYGRVQTEIAGHWYSTRFTFTVTANSSSFDTRLQSVQREAHAVRRMSELDGLPFAWTPLAQRLEPVADYVVCSDFAETLVDMLNEMNLGLAVMRRDVAFDTNGFEGHSLVNVQDPSTGRWLLVDPTFDLMVKRADGAWATAEEVSDAVASFNWSAVSYQLLGNESDPLPAKYYLDYPLLFLNVARPLVRGQGRSPVPYLTEMPVPTTGSWSIYMVQCLDPTADVVDVVIDGVRQTLGCDGIDLLTPAFGAQSVSAPSASAPPAFRLYRPRRYVF